MFDPVRRRRGKFVPVERGVGPRDDRPRVRVGGRFAGEVPSIEFGEGGVDVIKVEHDDAPTIRLSASISMIVKHLDVIPGPPRWYRGPRLE